MSELRESPFFSTHRTVALNPLVPDVADPATGPFGGPAFGFEAHDFTHASIYWDATGGVIATDDDNVTFRIITYDYLNAMWVRVKTVTLRHRERCNIPVMDGGIFVRVDAENTTATQMQIRVTGYTPSGADIADDPGYVTLPESGAGFAPGGAGGIADTGYVFTLDVAGITELHYEDSAGNITQLTSGGAAGLQAAYDIDDSIVTTAADGPVKIDRGAAAAAPALRINTPAAGGAPVADLFETIQVWEDFGGAAARLFLTTEANIVAAGLPAGFRHVTHEPGTVPKAVVLGQRSADYQQILRIYGRAPGAAPPGTVEYDYLDIGPYAFGFGFETNAGAIEMFIGGGGTTPVSILSVRPRTVAVTTQGSRIQALEETDNGGVAISCQFFKPRLGVYGNPNLADRTDIEYSSLGLIGAGAVGRHLFQRSSLLGNADPTGTLEAASIYSRAVVANVGVDAIPLVGTGSGVAVDAPASSFIASRTSITEPVSNATQVDGGRFRSEGRFWTGAVAASHYYDVYTEAIAGTDEGRRLAIYEDAVRIASFQLGLEQLRNTTDGAATGPVLEFFHDVATPAANDRVGEMRFLGRDNAGNPETYGFIRGISGRVTSGAEYGRIDFHINRAGGSPRVISLLPSGSPVGSEAGLIAISNLAAGGDVPIEVRMAANFTMAQEVLRVSDNAGSNILLQLFGEGNVYLTSTDPGAVGVEFQLYQNSATPAYNDVPGTIGFYGEDLASAKREYARMSSFVINAGAGAVYGGLRMDITDGGVTHQTNVQDWPWTLIANEATGITVGGGAGIVKGFKSHTNQQVDDARYQRTYSGQYNDGAPHTITGFTLPDYTAYWVVAHVSGYGTDTGTGKGYAAYKLWTLILRDGGAAQLGTGGAVVEQTDWRGNMAGWGAVLVNVGNTLSIVVTGTAGQTVNWSIYLEYQQVKDPT